MRFVLCQVPVCCSAEDAATYDYSGADRVREWVVVGSVKVKDEKMTLSQTDTSFFAPSASSALVVVNDWWVLCKRCVLPPDNISYCSAFPMMMKMMMSDNHNREWQCRTRIVIDSLMVHLTRRRPQTRQQGKCNYCMFNAATEIHVNCFHWGE